VASNCFIQERIKMLQLEVKALRRWAALLALAASVAFVPASPALSQVRGLPDFTELVEQVGPSVVNIRTLEKVVARPRGEAGQRWRRCWSSSGAFGVPIPNMPRQPAAAPTGRNRRKRSSHEAWGLGSS
jgi:serine protease Do